MSQTSANHPLDLRDPEQTCEREHTAQTPPDVYYARIAELMQRVERKRDAA